eukprot:2645228-Prymnesium_polylepis.1
MQGMKRIVVTQAAAQRASERAAVRGEVLSQAELEQRAGLVVEELPTEKEPREEPAPPLYFCEECPKKFTNAGALRSHSVWIHRCKAQKGNPLEISPLPFKGNLTTTVAVDGGAVKLSIMINGKDRAQLDREEAEALQKWEAAKAAREAEAHRRRVAMQAQRDREEAVDFNLGRRGSAHRHQYSAAEKLSLIELLDELNSNGNVRNVGDAFEADKRSKGCPYSTAVKWLKPAEKRKIRIAASQDRAKKLLRIDTESRKKGKYVPMEKELFCLFRLRRAKARKTSSKCACWAVSVR